MTAHGGTKAMAVADDWWKTAVVYQIYTRSFLDTDGDGVGDLEGIIAKLDYLQSLGIDIIWLSPLHPSPNIDYGYDTTDYYGVAPEFGTLDTFDRLIAEAKARGIRVMMDLVMDYTSSAHPWFVQARSSRTNPYHDWYIWQDSPPDQPPNNWPAFFSCGPAWTFDPSTRRWYLHYFAEEQPELNWANPAVRAAMHDVMRFWLARGICGFRLDVISFLSKPEGFPDMPEIDKASAGRFYANGPRLHEYLQEMRREVFDHFPGSMALGEGFGLTSDQVLDFVAPERRELDLMFLFEISALTFAETGDRQRPSVPAIRDVLRRWDEMLVPAGAWPVLFLGNHDVARMVSRFGDERPELRAASAKLLLTLLMTLRGTPVIYQGDEIGMANPRFDNIAEFRDIAVLNAWRLADEADRPALLKRMNQTGRDTGRTPVQWTAKANAGFSDRQPWIKVADDYGAWNVEGQEGDPSSVLEHFRVLGRLRRTEEALQAGQLSFRSDVPNNVLAYERSSANQRLLLFLNWSAEPAAVSSERPTNAPLLCSHGALQWQGDELTLRPYEAVIVEMTP